jgi:hypothetical protein
MHIKKVLVTLMTGSLFAFSGSLSIKPASMTSTPGTVQAAAAMAFVSGTVRNDNGLPLVGATVALLESSIAGKVLKSLKTDAEGRFTAGIVPGAYRLRAEAEGYRATFTRINLERTGNLTFNFSLRRRDTLVDKRGDSDDWRWIGRTVPRSILHYDDADEIVSGEATASVENQSVSFRPTFHGIAQFVASGAASATNAPGSSFAGSNFAVSASLNNNLEVAVIGQSGFGDGAPQRLALVSTTRVGDKHQFTAGLGYGRLAIRGENRALSQSLLEQASLSVTDSWQVAQPLLIVYGVDYSRFVGAVGRNRESILPRLAVQYSPTSQMKLHAALTSARNFRATEMENLETENIDASISPEAAFDLRPTEVAVNSGGADIDRSRRLEFGIERTFDDGSALEAAAFFDTISGHGVGILALPLEATQETELAFQQGAHQVAAMNGAARGMRVVYSRQLNDYASVSGGYSFGRGEKFNRRFHQALADGNADTLNPGQVFTGGFFQVATARLNLDLSHQTGTNISAVIRLSPSAVVFAIDPFAGRMSVYDPNLSVYLTQNLPTFGLPVSCQAIVDVRNLLDQAIGTEDGRTQLIAARTQRMVRGGLAFRW